MSYPDITEFDDQQTIKCEVKYIKIKNKLGDMIPGVRVTCLSCNHSTESFGQTDKSINRCLALLHEECPMNENNWYEVI